MIMHDIDNNDVANNNNNYIIIIYIRIVYIFSNTADCHSHRHQPVEVEPMKGHPWDEVTFIREIGPTWWLSGDVVGGSNTNGWQSQQDHHQSDHRPITTNQSQVV